MKRATNKDRRAGVLLAISSLPSRYGIGDFGKGAYRFVDDLVKGGFKLWQLLPLNALGFGESPYQPFSSYALDYRYIDLDELARRKSIARPEAFQENATKVDYQGVKAFKDKILEEAFAHEMNSPRRKGEVKRFIEANAWVKEYATFMVFKKSHKLEPWQLWSRKEQDYIANPFELNEEQSKEFDYQCWLQMSLYRQWDALHAYANSKGIKIIGDIPFYVGLDSADVWAHQENFLLDGITKKPTFIAGVPPDYFSATGQRWGNPIYDWAYMKKHDYSFFMDRIHGNSKIYDIIRLDHFRAFDTYWKVPASCPTAMEGEWIEGPAYKFFNLLYKKYPELDIIAEDLGNLRPEVLKLRDRYNLPGMNVIQFTFKDAEIDKATLWNKENQVCYLGTHDNDTMMGYFEKLEGKEQYDWFEALDKMKYFGPIDKRMLSYCLGLKAHTAIIAMQDLLSLGSEARMNLPGVIQPSNWVYRMKDLKAFERRLPTIKKMLVKSKRA